MGQLLSWTICHYLPSLDLETCFPPGMNGTNFSSTTIEHLTPRPQYIVPGADWYDTSGDAIQAHGAGMIKVNSTFYWFGEDKTLNNALFRAVSVYNSTDLYTWTRLPDALTPVVNTSISGDMIVERPKVVYNAKNDEYVMWFHNDNSAYSAAMVGVANSSTPAGPYSYVHSFRPFGTDSRDESVYVDDDGSAYLLFASDGNMDFKIAQLDEDYKNVTNITYQFTGAGYEAPGIVKHNNTYFLFVSGLTGWSPNPNLVLTSPSLSGNWSAATNLANPGLRTYYSQNGYDLPLGLDANASTVLYIGDRWDSSALGSSKYVWLPFTFENGTATLDWVDVFSLDPETGAISIPNGTVYPASQGIVNGSAILSECVSCFSGSVVQYLGGGGYVTITNVTGEGQEQWVSVWYANGDWSWRNVSISVNGGPALVIDQPDTGGPGNFLSVPIRLFLDNSTSNNITFGANQTNFAGDMDKIVIYP